MHFFSGKLLSHVSPEEIQNFKFRILIGSDANSANSDVTTTRKCNDVQNDHVREVRKINLIFEYNKIENCWKFFISHALLKIV